MLDIVPFHLHKLDVRGPLWCWRKQCCCCHDNGSIAFTLTHAECFLAATRPPGYDCRCCGGKRDRAGRTCPGLWIRTTDWPHVWVTAARLSRWNAPYKEATNCCQLTTTSTREAKPPQRRHAAKQQQQQLLFPVYELWLIPLWHQRGTSFPASPLWREHQEDGAPWFSLAAPWHPSGTTQTSLY